MTDIIKKIYLEDYSSEKMSLYAVVTNFTEERKSPYCQNPDKDAFYDCGDPEEFEFDLSLEIDAKDGKVNRQYVNELREDLTEYALKEFKKDMGIR